MSKLPGLDAGSVLSSPTESQGGSCGLLHDVRHIRRFCKAEEVVLAVLTRRQEEAALVRCSNTGAWPVEIWLVLTSRG